MSVLSVLHQYYGVRYLQLSFTVMRKHHFSEIPSACKMLSFKPFGLTILDVRSGHLPVLSRRPNTEKSAAWPPYGEFCIKSGKNPAVIR